MRNRYTLLFYLPIILAAAVIMLRTEADITSLTPVNRVIGDQSYVEIYGEAPDKDTPERLRIRTHLLYVEDILRERPTAHLTPEQKRNRAHNLNLLREYIEAGNFPRNGAHADDRLPTFINGRDKICAVGYLVQQTAGAELAERINRRLKYTYIPTIDDAAFEQWATLSGFTKQELALIQPTYGGEREKPESEVKTSYATPG